MGAIDADNICMGMEYFLLGAREEDTLIFSRVWGRGVVKHFARILERGENISLHQRGGGGIAPYVQEGKSKYLPVLKNCSHPLGVN